MYQKGGRQREGKRDSGRVRDKMKRERNIEESKGTFEENVGKDAKDN